MAKVALKGGKAPAVMVQRFSDDAVLREHGFRIHARPNEFTAFWWKDGRTWSHAEAMAHSGRKERAK